MYTYCNNNSIMYTDSTGKSIDLTILLLLALGLCLGLTSCGTTTPRPKNQLLANPFEDYPNYASFDDLLKEACQKVYTATAEAGFTKEFGTTIFIIPYDSAYDVDEDRADNYWMSDVYNGTAEKVDHNMARLNEDHVDIFAYIHSHVDNDEREANGGFSGKDCQNIPQNQKHIKQYVITKEGFVYEFNPLTGTGGEKSIFQCS